MGGMRLDSTGLKVLSRADCLALLTAAPIGRIVFTDRALPAVQPVNFVLDGEDIIIRTTAGSKLSRATRNAVVAFEADEFNPETRTGWSVAVVGRARAVTEPAEYTRLEALPLRPWAPGSRDHFIAISTEQTSGRLIIANPAGPRAAQGR